MVDLSTRQYVGARYVPKLMGEWDNKISYENLVIVTYKGNSFTSRQPVPQGIDIGNTDYWVNTGNYNAQVNELNIKTSSLEAKINNLFYNVKNYGAKGDGATDDTMAINNAIVDLNKTGGTLYFPYGNYIISNTLNILHNGCAIIGDNFQSTYLSFKNSNGIIFGNGTTRIYGGNIENISIISISNDNIGVTMNNCVNMESHNIIISNFQTGVKLSATGNSVLNNVFVTSNTVNSVGFNVGNKSVSSVLNDCSVGFDDNTKNNVGYYSGDGDIADITLNHFECSNCTVGIHFNGINSPDDFPPADIVLNRIVIDNSRVTGIKIDNVNNKGDLIITNCWINPAHVSSSACMAITNSNNVIISNNVLQSFNVDTPIVQGINFVNNNKITINNNIFKNLLSCVSSSKSNKIIIFGNNITSDNDSNNVCIYLVDNKNGSINENMINGNYTVGSIIISGTSTNSIITNNIVNGNGTVSSTATAKILKNIINNAII